MTRALVLGGGGPVGIGWQAGLLEGLTRSGVDVGGADAVIGTSAGSVVGATLTLGRDPAEGIQLVESAGRTHGTAADGEAAAAAANLEQLMAALSEAAQDPDRAEAIRARLGRLALASATIDEETWLQPFDYFGAGAGGWPAGFACTAVDAETGRFKVWTAADGVELRLAIASSCAVPGVFPPVTVQGKRWMDGGVRDMLNSDAAAGHQTVLAVSCLPLELPEGLAMPSMDAVFGATRAQLDGLRDGGSKVETIVPGAEMLEISEWGLSLMDFGRARAAYDAGARQGEVEAGRLSGFWAA